MSSSSTHRVCLAALAEFAIDADESACFEHLLRDLDALHSVGPAQ
jgi:hypothetical protein